LFGFFELLFFVFESFFVLFPGLFLGVGESNRRMARK